MKVHRGVDENVTLAKISEDTRASEMAEKNVQDLKGWQK